MILTGWRICLGCIFRTTIAAKNREIETSRINKTTTTQLFYKKENNSFPTLTNVKDLWNSHYFANPMHTYTSSLNWINIIHIIFVLLYSFHILQTYKYVWALFWDYVGSCWLETQIILSKQINTILVKLQLKKQKVFSQVCISDKMLPAKLVRWNFHWLGKHSHFFK